MDGPIIRKPPPLSKSRFLAGLQCPLRLWYQCYAPELAAEITPAQQAVFDTGHAVGRLATGRYPGGTWIEEDHRQHVQAVQATVAVIKQPDTPAVFEAAFEYAAVRVRVDVLQRRPGDRWNLVEVKSAAGVKDVHVWDVAVQVYVLLGCGLRIHRAGLLHLNTGYVYQGGEPSLGDLFHLAELTPQAVSRQEDVQAHLARFRQVLAASRPPVVAPSRHCKNPYPCEFWEHCTESMPEFWVLQLSGITQGRLQELSRIGVADIRDIPAGFPLTETQERIRTSVCSGTEYLSSALAAELRSLQYPIHFLDFETVAPAVPRHPGTRPYQTLPFQFSDHILHRDGCLDHPAYLCRHDQDPREEFTAKLLDVLGSAGSIVIYTGYEREIVRALAEDLPSKRDALQSIVERMRDLHAMIKKHYYHPGFRGSFSLKSVLPVLLPEMGYAKLAIREGSQASLEYLRMVDPLTPAAEKERIAENLLAYCRQDTLAMVRIREELLSRTNAADNRSPACRPG